jgi:1,4-alpha-glucan branching enzyme
MVRSAHQQVSREEIQKIVESRHDAPHTVLGAHFVEEDKSLVIRAFLPQMARALVCEKGAPGRKYAMARIHEAGLFEATILDADDALQYELLATNEDGETARFHDAYAITTTTFSADDQQAFRDGTHSRLFEKLGAHPATRDGLSGVNFAVWAPNGQRVSVVGTFNRWDGRWHQMRRVGETGIWELFVPDVVEAELYKYEIKTPDGTVFLKTDPFAFCTESPPNTAGIVCGMEEQFFWSDDEWLKNRNVKEHADRPIAIFALDLDALIGKTEDASAHPSYKGLLTHKLVASIREGGNTHVELSSSAHGATSSFCPDMRYGPPADLMAFVDSCHQRGIGVILPSVPACFPRAPEELAWFDGTRLYEGNEHGGAWALDTGKGEVRSFVLSNARFWLEHYHVDAVRTDARAGALCLEVVRSEQERLTNARLIVREPFTESTIDAEDARRILRARHDDPYAVLGAHYMDTLDALALRALIPEAEQLYAVVHGRPEVLYELTRIHKEGLFEAIIPELGAGTDYRLRVIEQEGRSHELIDPYDITSFSFSEFDQHLFAQGNHYGIFQKLGAHPRVVDTVSGVGFAVWAPNAEGVSVVGPFNRWDGRRHQMKLHGPSGVWEIFIPELGEGDLYKYEVRARNGDTFLKSDPYAFFTEVPPDTASIVYELESAHRWDDDEWMSKRRHANVWEQPVSIYEVHLGSWTRAAENTLLNYIELSKKLVPYVKQMGFTHIELLPIAEHPYGPSWGYQVSNFYAPTSRYGKPHELMALVDRCHQEDIGVILDWVPGHFPKDAHSLAWFDGTCVYEHADPRIGEHPDWGTLIFNYGRHEVENFLIANALFWLETYHLDGLRVDAVASMLYLDYSRGLSGSWLPNIYGGSENLEAIEFLKHTNSIVYQRCPDVMMVAEESTAWPSVSRPLDQGGLGFGFKWNMGWMHDLLAYVGVHPNDRKHHHNKLTFGIHYAFHENFILSLSHDEVVHLKGSLLHKMPGSEWEKFANLRLLFGFMYAHPGKKLLFMGGEFAQRDEWSHDKALDWEVLERGPHKKFSHFVRNLNQLYRSERAFFEVDFKSTGFEWVDVDNAEESLIAFLRKAKDPRNALLFAFNFSLVSRPRYRIGVPYPTAYLEVFSSNAIEYGGSGGAPAQTEVVAKEMPHAGQAFSIELPLPALSLLVLKPAPADTTPVTENGKGS